MPSCYFGDVYNTGLIIGTKIRLELDRAKDNFVLMQESADKEKYKVKLLYIALYMPIASLSQDVSREINSILTKDNPVKIQYRNIEIRPLTITKQTTSFYSELLFSDSVPARLVLVFVETEAKNGSRYKNPFNFRRKWTYTVEANETEEPVDPSLAYAEQRIKQVEETNRKLLESLQSIQEQLTVFASKGKGKGKGKTSKRPSTAASITDNLQNVQLNDLATPSEDVSLAELRRLSSASSSTTRRETDIQSLPSTSSRGTRRETDTGVRAPTTKDFYITNIDLTINGVSVDQGGWCYKTT